MNFDFLKPFLDFFADPLGAFMKFACDFIGLVAAIFPSTPTQFTLAGIANSLGSGLPFIGSGIIFGILKDVSLILGLVVIIKVYKLIPFKMS